MSLLVDRLREARESKGFSQRELARLCGLGENQIHRYEAGKSDPSATHLKLIADKLEVSTDYLLGLSNEPRGQLVQSDLDNNELEVVEAYRREGWIGIIRLGTDRIAK
ncbi:MAG TPA: helix-turn-helix transcriptional regulator [Aggregatilineaceae bacterium]|nr:helix-turn-helix transcriptional regulator [Aggregatilineaceae bacterium]